MKILRLLLALCIVFFLDSCRNSFEYFWGGERIKSGLSDLYNDDTVKEHVKDEEDRLRVAVLVPLSGQVKAVGESIVNALQLSLFENNKRNVLLKIYDTKATTFGAVEAINKAIDDGIDVVIGPLFSSETKAIKSILLKNDLVAFSLSNDQELMNTSNVFVTGSIPEQEIQILISYMMENDFRNFVALMPNTTHGALMNKILRSTILNKDGLLIKTEYYEPNDKTLMTKISDLSNFYEVPQTLYENYEKQKLEQKLLGSGDEPEFIITEEEKIYPQVLFIPDGGKIAEQIANFLFINQKNDRFIQLIGTTKLDGDDSIMVNPYMNNVVFVGANPDKYKKFSDSYERIYKVKPLKITSMVYDLVNIVDSVFENVDGKYLPNKRALLHPEGFDGIDGKFRFLPNGLVERRMYILQFQDKQKVVVGTNQEFLNY
ncbi:MAG: penicillin-binding protein activator [Rickettsiales bacterium]|jgi:ABC-type branched-subunit amino acid transport system substrate-binding protein|nr:penicillin-binding protein activator [Rickettsiales bacterium]